MKSSLLRNSISFSKGYMLIIIASFYCSCDNNTAYQRFNSLPEEGWNRQDTMYFAATLKDSLQTYKITLEIRNRSSYIYTNLPILFSMRTPQNKNNIKDSLFIKLANSKGEWLGKGWGELYQYQYTVGHIYTKSPGIYLFRLSYLLPDKKLQGINDIGLKLEKQ